MKRILCIVVALLTLLLSSCRIQQHETVIEFYYDYDMNEYITVGKYDSVIKRDSKEYGKAAHEFFLGKFENTLSYQTDKGVVELWDVANINFLGRLDGRDVEGCSDMNLDVTVGSGDMSLAALEEKLVGLEIGKEYDFGITMPNDFIDEKARGKEVSFKVVVNYATKYKDVDDSAAKKAGYASAKEYQKAEDDFAIGCCMYNRIYDATKFNSYPEKETDALIEAYYTAMHYKAEKSGTTIEKMIADRGMTVAEFEEVLIESIQQNFKNMPRDLVSYYILQTNNAKLDENDIFMATEDLKKIHGENLEEVGYVDVEIQRYAAYNKAIKIARELATVK